MLGEQSKIHAFAIPCGSERIRISRPNPHSFGSL
jgi:hypothetical protein